MASYKAPTQDILFVLNDILKIDELTAIERFADASPDIVAGVVEEAAKVIEEEIAPLNHKGDEIGCKYADGEVDVPPGYVEAYKLFQEGGWIGLANEPDFGGQGLPFVLSKVVGEMVCGANVAFELYIGLTQDCYEAIMANGSDEQKQKYLPNMISGEWGGTMNLTEPHCGTDLGLLKTKAVPQGDGSYKISGQKIFISAGEHDLTDNIIHLVLARIEGAPEGVKGISLFIVPKFRINEDGSLGERNGVSCGSIEEKMGIHANSTCVMNYDEATGWLLGEENKGLRAMFTMMNEARLGVGMQGLAISEVSYQNGAAYAKDRLQGRALTGPADPEKPADPIIVHPDVRRMLMDHRAFTEGARAWMYWSALYGDLVHKAEDDETRQKADDYMGLMTPILKAYLTDKGYAHATNAQQVLGGHGYIQEWGMEQIVRDARIAMIYEGANGIQALDLVGRKLPKDGGRAIMTFFAEIDEFVKDNEGNEELKPWLDGLSSAKADLTEATQWFMANAMQNPNNAGASSMDYLGLFALTCLAYAWAQMAKAALEKKESGDAFYKNKLITGKYFLDRILPEKTAHLAKVKSGSEAMMALDAEAF